MDGSLGDELASAAGAAPDDVVLAAARAHVSSHTRLIRSARDGARLSAAMMPVFRIRSPRGYAVITTTGRKTGKPRRKCVRAIRQGSKVFLVQLRPPEVALSNPSVLASWVWNLRSNPAAMLRLGFRDVSVIVHEANTPSERQQARQAFTETVHLFDYGECAVHLRGLPSRRKIRDLHRYWFDTGVPLIAESDA